MSQASMMDAFMRKKNSTRYLRERPRKQIEFLVSLNYKKKVNITKIFFLFLEKIDEMRIPQTIQRLVFHKIDKPLRRKPRQCNKGFCQFCLHTTKLNQGVHRHEKRMHNSSFQDSLAKYYDLATVLLDPNFRLVWDRFESPRVGLEDFVALLDQELKVKIKLRKSCKNLIF